jgi:hypothetical protein
MIAMSMGWERLLVGIVSAACHALTSPALAETCARMRTAIEELDGLTLRLRVVDDALLHKTAKAERAQLEADRCQTIRRTMEIRRRASEANCPMPLMRVRDTLRGVPASRCAP